MAASPFARASARSMFLSAVTAMAMAAGEARADTLDGVSIDRRAQLAVAASAYPPDEAPDLVPSSPTFAPDTAPAYLETDEDGRYGVSLVRDSYRVSFTILRFDDQDSAAAGFESWKSSGDSATPLDWGGSFPAFRRGQGLLGIGLAGAGLVARGQSGRWHFEVTARSEAGATPSGSELEAGIAAMKAIADNARLYRLFPRDLVVVYRVAGGEATRLPPGARFQVPIEPDGETQAVFTLQVLDDGEPVPAVDYTVALSGALAGVAEVEQGGNRTKGSIAEAASPNGQAVDVTFVFPPALDEEVSTLMQEEEAGTLELKVEARVSQGVLP
jgi:hypothetical protein